ncbi:hypothetical protein EWM62_09260 [Mucilaginibacter terrigena]|uniref:PH domain-containing protein n=1 Tax=Mucilaginibacter terrigena TaxID=2492395 RepID=A0A4Q5LNL6_9SPHI|nr:STM3941 family protein [Mucilaginibacter terrigena]RYU90819.1 hypothetical protein EWM62_09260 [Mucilaginibacter terrigena]
MQPTNPLDVTEIPLSKTKMTLALAGSALFVAAGVWFVSNPYQFHRNHILIMAIGIAAIVVFGVVALYIVNKLFDTQAGFVIDNDGFTDNSSMLSVGFVPWEDVLGLNVVDVNRQKIIVVVVNDADGYIRRQPNALSRRIASLNNRMYGSPVAVSANSLRISFDELYKLIQEKRPNL